MFMGKRSARKSTLLTVLLAGVLVLVSGGCLLDSLWSSTGTVALYLADAPGDLQHLYVVLEKVEIVRDGEGPQTISHWPEGKEFDLLTLQLDEELLGEAEIPAGNYNQIRLVLKAYSEDETPPQSLPVSMSRAVFQDPSAEPLVVPVFIPSGEQTGLKIKHEFQVNDGELAEMILDVDLAGFLKQNHWGESDNPRLVLRPTCIRVVDERRCGAIAGQVLGVDNAPIADGDVTVQVLGDDGTESEVADEDGRFKIRGVPPGTFSIVVQADGYKSETVESIVVETGETTELEDPIILARQ